MTLTHPTFIVKDSQVCSCGEQWHVIATEYNEKFMWAKTFNQVKMFYHRAYNCPKLSLRLNREVSQ